MLEMAARTEKPYYVDVCLRRATMASREVQGGILARRCRRESGVIKDFGFPGIAFTLVGVLSAAHATRERSSRCFLPTSPFRRSEA